MALIVEDGHGLADAESYQSVAGADTYHAANGAPAAWTALSTSAKEAALRAATQYLDTIYHRQWVGVKVSDEQRLDWPRSDVEDVNGFGLASDELPPRLLDATSLMALRSVVDGDLIPDIAEPGSLASESVTVGPISVSNSWNEKSQTKRYRRVELLLADYITSTTGELERG